jgi:DNA topoisomerase-1
MKALGARLPLLNWEIKPGPRAERPGGNIEATRGTFAPSPSGARLPLVNGASTATLEFADPALAQTTAEDLCGQSLVVVNTQSRIIEEAPPRPFTTLDLLEDAARNWSWPGRKTMNAAQALFEAGYITYPRSDSTQVAPEAVTAVREVVSRLYGSEALAPMEVPRRNLLSTWLDKRDETEDPPAHSAEAHEAIRPTDPARMPKALTDLADDTLALYCLIWQRLLASQMQAARYKLITVEFRRSP